MAFQDDRLSTQVVDADWKSPDELDRNQNEDYEQGPIAVGDSSQGMNYQQWHLTWDGGTDDFTITPADTGPPVVVHNDVLVTQCSLAFDQNGNVNIAYTSNGQAKFYWYDTDIPGHTTDTLDADVIAPMLCLDDKRQKQVAANDVLLMYTKPNGVGGYKLFFRKQRERYLQEDELRDNVLQYLVKLGMHDGLRVKIGLTSQFV